MFYLWAGADPGFLVGGGTDPLGAPTYDFVKISQKMHEIEKILGHGGGGEGARRGAPPLIRHCWVMFILTVRITEAFSSNKLSLFSNYKVMMLLCRLKLRTHRAAAAAAG